jgi:hypothetical protein
MQVIIFPSDWNFVRLQEEGRIYPGALACKSFTTLETEQKYELGFVYEFRLSPYGVVSAEHNAIRIGYVKLEAMRELKLSQVSEFVARSVSGKSKEVLLDEYKYKGVAEESQLFLHLWVRCSDVGKEWGT